MDEIKKLFGEIADLAGDLQIIVNQADKQGFIYPIDIDLLLEKTRNLYEKELKLKQHISQADIDVKAQPLSRQVETVKTDSKKPAVTKKAFSSGIDFKIPPPEKEDEEPEIKENLPDLAVISDNPVSQPLELEITRDKGSNQAKPEKLIVRTETFQDSPKPQPKKKPAGQELKPAEKTTPLKPSKKSGQEDQEINIIADKFEKGHSVHDKIGTAHSGSNLASKLTSTKIADLRKAIPLNDKIMYIKDLFNGDSNKYESALTALNSCQSYTEAFRYIEPQIELNAGKEAVKRFTELLKRKFNESIT